MVDIGAAAVMGIALETTSGTYLAPVKFVPFYSESLTYQQDTNWRRPIRNTAGLVGAAPGNASIGGDITIDALMDVIPYFLMASRCTFTKTGTGPYTYVFTPASVATPAKTMSIAIRRGSTEVMGYTGCVVSSFTISVGDDGQMSFSVTVTGANEASQAALSGITWPTTTPPGAGQYQIQIPTATQVFDTDTFEFQSEDNADPQFRLKNTTGAQFVAFGESNATIKVERDFNNRTDYDGFKSLTSQSLTFIATKSVNEQLTLVAPVAFKDTYEINIGGQGDLIRSSIQYQCAIDATGKHYQITIICAENIP